MKFRTADLIARIDSTIKAREDGAATKNAEAVELAGTQKQAWLDTHAAGYVEFANRIKDKIRKGRPITKSDVPEVISGGWSSGIGTFYSDSHRSPYVARTDDLLTLKAALMAVEDEYVTTTGLREIGFKDFNSLFAGAR